MAGYQPGSPWPAFKGCSTRLGQSKLMGPALSRTGLNFRTNDLGADVVTTVVAADGTMYAPAGTRLHAFRSTGALAWNVDLGGVFGILSTPAIGSDGTIYVASNMQLKALNPANGALRWAYDMSFGSLVISSVTIGPDRTIYIADQEGVVHAVTPSGTRKWAVDPSFLSRELINVSPVLSSDGRTLYIGTLPGKFYALDAATGATRWTSPINIGETATAAVGEDGTIYVASALGILYALSPADGSRIWETLVDLPFVPTSALTAAPALTPQGTIVVGTLGGKLVNIDRTGRILWATNKLCSYFVSSPTVDAGGTIYIGDNVGIMRAIDSRTGAILWSYATGGEIWATPAIGPEGELIFGSNDNRLYSIGKNNALVLVREPRVPVSVPTFPDGSTSPNPPTTPSTQIKAPYCTIASVAGEKRPGVNFTERLASPGVEYIENFVLSDTTDPDCNAHLCSAEEVRLSASDELRLLSAPSGRMPAGATDTCDAVEAPARCPMKRNGVNYARTCTPAAGCGAGQICALACPQMPGSPGTPLPECPVEQRANFCVTLETARCTGLTGPESPDPVRGITDCHEVRECARDDDKITQAEAVPSCNNKSCDFTTTAAPPTRVGENTTSYPAMNLWTAPTNAMCQLVQPEKASSVQNGGSPDGANSSGAKKQKKWGIRAYADVNGSAGLEPLPFGLFIPNARAVGKIGVEGTIVGNTIKVVEIGGEAKLGKCSVTASGGLTLFGQRVKAYSIEPVGYTDTEGKCAAFFQGLDFASGPLKNNLYQAARMALSAKEQAERVSQGLQSQVIVTRAMCDAALGSTSCDPTKYQSQAAAFAQLPAKVANTYIDRYNEAVDAVQARIDKARNQLLGGANGYLSKLNPDGFVTVPNTSFEAQTTLLSLNEKRSFAAAAAYFPIGPVTLSLEIEGYTTWGADGGLTYGVRFFPDGNKLPGVWATAGVTPAAGLYVDVFLGVGFEFGIAGASAGIGGDILLAEIKAPVSGTIRAELKEVALPETRPLPSELQAFAGNGLRLAPKRYRFGVSGGIGAGMTFTALKGNVDVRVRVRFLFFSKTWKKRFVKFDGFSKSYSWTGGMSADGKSISTPIGLDAINLEVMPTLSLPRIPAISPSIFTGYLPTVGWPTVNVLPEGTVKSHLRTLETAGWPCEEPPGPI